MKNLMRFAKQKIRSISLREKKDFGRNDLKPSVLVLDIIEKEIIKKGDVLRFVNQHIYNKKTENLKLIEQFLHPNEYMFKFDQKF